MFSKPVWHAAAQTTTAEMSSETLRQGSRDTIKKINGKRKNVNCIVEIELKSKQAKMILFNLAFKKKTAAKFTSSFS